MANQLLKIIITPIIILSGCCNGNRPEPIVETDPGVHYHYDSLGRIAIEDAMIDSIGAKLIFDTDFMGKVCFSMDMANRLDSSWSQKVTFQDAVNGWNGIHYKSFIVKEPVNIRIGNALIHYDEYSVFPKGVINLNGNDGVFGIPEYDPHFWILNAERNTLSIADSLPSLSTSYESEYVLNDSLSHWFIKDFPLKFTISNSSFVVSEDLMMDTGSSSAITLFYSTKDQNFEKIIARMPSYRLPKRHGSIYQATLYLCKEYGDSKIPMWITHQYHDVHYTFEGEMQGIVVGNNFLKCYNLCIAPSKGKIYFSPINKEYCTVENETGTKFKVAEGLDKQGIVYELLDTFFIYYGKDSLLVGDLLISIDGEKMFDRGVRYFKDKTLPAAITYVRDGDTLETNVVVNEAFR